MNTSESMGYPRAVVRQLCAWWIMVMLVGFCGRALAERPLGFKVYTVQPGDTLESLSTEFMGGPGFVDELLGYNEIANPVTVIPGTLLAIPLQVRRDAIQALSKAEIGIGEAADAMAEEFATEEFADAISDANEARRERARGAYSKALAKAELATVKAKECVRLAKLRAQIQQEAIVSAVAGLVEVSTDHGASWVKVADGGTLPVSGQLRTGEGSRAEVTLADGSVIQIAHSSVFELQNFLLDRRDGKRNSKLKVIVGNILGQVEPRKVESSVFEIDTGGAAIAIRGTAMRVGVEDGSSRLSVLEGLAELSAAGKQEIVPADFGSFVRKGRPPAKPVRLLDPPTGLVPPMAIHQTALQTPLFRWQRIENRRVSSYHLEIARDVDFNAIVQDHVVSVPECRADVLPEGTYYWHVSTTDKRGLEGKFSRPRELRVRKHYDVEIVPSKPLFEYEGRLLASHDVVFDARPVRKDSSVVKMEYSLDGESYQNFSEPLIFQDGDQRLFVRGVTREGDSGVPADLVFRVDGTPPDLKADVSEPIPTELHGVVVTVQLEATDESGVDRVEYSTDGVSFVEYDNPLQFNVEDMATVFAYAYDVLQNRSEKMVVDLGPELE